MNILISSLFRSGLRALGLPRACPEDEINEPEINQSLRLGRGVYVNFKLGSHLINLIMNLEGDISHICLPEEASSNVAFCMD